MSRTWISLFLLLSLLWMGKVEAQTALQANDLAAKVVVDQTKDSQTRFAFEPPVRLTFEGRPIEVEFPGYACPTMVDFAGEGVFDLVVGQFAKGNFQHFRNKSAAGEIPQFSNRQWLMTKDGRASIPGIRCCTSSTPQFVDWNADGRLDILSGCYATPGFPSGHIVMLLGEPQFKFSSAIYLTGSRGERLQNADFNFPGDQAQRLKDSICTHAHAVDLDQDGDLDLVVGASSKSFFHFENLGDARRFNLQQPPTKLSIDSPSNRTAPHCVDWNRDGLVDLLTGGSDGGVYLSLNGGTPKNPVWSTFVALVEPSERQVQLASDAKENKILPGHSSRIWAFDWDGNGKLDLLVGDCVSLLKPGVGIAEESFREQERAWQLKKNEMESLRDELNRRDPNGLTGSAARSVVGTEDLRSQLKNATSEFQQLESLRYQWAQESKTGFVWLYLQK